MVQNLRSRLIQPTASSSRGLSWPRSFGLGLSKPRTWKCSYKCTKTLSAACWSRERLLRLLERLLCFQLYPRPSRLRDACCSGGKAGRSFSNDDGNGKEDVKKAIGLLRKTTTLHVHHAFLYISLPSLRDYDVKMPNCKFYWGRKQATTNLFFSL